MVASKNGALATLQAAKSQLLIIDMQVKLSLAMPAEHMQIAIKNTQILLQAAHLLNQPTIITEQYPQGLGETLLALSQHVNSMQTIAKMAFSACGEAKFNQQLSRDKCQVLIAGMEAHICVLQTALDLQGMGKQVFVVEDAIISRNLDHKANAIARMREAGCIITNTESALFECLGSANHEAFKAISKLIR